MMNKRAYYISNLTWGLPMTSIGLIIACVLICTGHKPKRWGGCIYFNVGKEYWGGVSLGLVFLADPEDDEHTKNHEFGHSIQNAKYGLLMPFIVAIPSFLRACYHTIRDYCGLQNKPYDSIWFEGEATELGNKYINHWEGR